MRQKLGPLPRRRASDSVYDILRNAILTQTFAPGERLNVHELAEKLDVSLTPVKEAVNRLAAEDLVEIRPRAGTFVSAISPDDVAETFQIRAALEALAAALALDHITDRDIARLRQIVGAMAAPPDDDAARARHESLNAEFHDAIVSLSGNRRLMQMLRSLNAHIQIARIHRGRDEWRMRVDAEQAEHETILEALTRKDERALAEAVRNHIHRAADSLVRDLAHQLARRQAPTAVAPEGTPAQAEPEQVFR